MLCLLAYKMGVGDFDLQRFSFIMHDIPFQRNVTFIRLYWL